VSTTIGVTRKQLSSFLTDQELIRQFERLFELAASIDKTTPGEVTVDDNVSEADRKSIEAVSSLEKFKQEQQYQQYKPEVVDQEKPKVQYIDFDRNAPHVNKTGRLVWNTTDETLDIHHPNGVTQQVGHELFILVSNDTASTIPNGTLVGFSGVGVGEVIRCNKFISNNTVPGYYVLGVLTEDLLVSGVARCTTHGNVRDLDTTGAPYSESWSQGDVLYASPTVAGGFTKNKPTASNLSIPVAIVLKVGASDGALFVRTTAEQPLYYGSILKTTNQSPAVINTAYAMTFDSAPISVGVSIGSPTSRVVVQKSGLYTFSYSIQISSTNASIKNVWLWFRKNGADVANSSVKVSLESASAILVVTRSVFFSLLASEYIEIMFAADNVNVSISNIGSTAFAPASPACILTIDQIQQ
jgi:hypothetical protein